MRPGLVERGFIVVVSCDVQQFSRGVPRRRLVCRCIFAVPRGFIPARLKRISALKGLSDGFCWVAGGARLAEKKFFLFFEGVVQGIY